MLSRAISIILGSSCIGYEGCGGLFCSVAVKRAGHPGIGLTRFWTAGFRYPVFCTLIPRSASDRNGLGRRWRLVLLVRSQKSRASWDRLNPILDRWIPVPRVLHPYPPQRFRSEE